MTVVATASNPRFSVSRVDIDRPGNTYTVDTLKDLQAERGSDVGLFFITGADALASILAGAAPMNCSTWPSSSVCRGPKSTSVPAISAICRLTR